MSMMIYIILVRGADYSFRELVSLYDDDDLVKTRTSKKICLGKPEVCIPAAFNNQPACVSHFV